MIMHFHAWTQQQILFVPMGWLTVEKASGEPLVYGVRKSLMTSSEANARVYAKLIEMAQAGGRSVERMQAIKALMNAPAVV